MVGVPRRLSPKEGLAIGLSLAVLIPVILINGGMFDTMRLAPESREMLAEARSVTVTDAGTRRAEYIYELHIGNTILSTEPSKQNVLDFQPPEGTTKLADTRIPVVVEEGATKAIVGTKQDKVAAMIGGGLMMLLLCGLILLAIVSAVTRDRRIKARRKRRQAAA